jgi:hypothetical protein
VTGIGELGKLAVTSTRSSLRSKYVILHTYYILYTT